MRDVLGVSSGGIIQFDTMVQQPIFTFETMLKFELSLTVDPTLSLTKSFASGTLVASRTSLLI